MKENTSATKIISKIIYEVTKRDTSFFIFIILDYLLPKHLEYVLQFSRNSVV